MKYLPGVMNADWILIPLHFASFPDHWLATLWFTQVCCNWRPWLISQFFSCNENHRHKIYRFLFCITHYTLVRPLQTVLQPITCWSSCTDCAESVFQFFPLFHARRAQSTEQIRARRSHRKPRRVRTWPGSSSRQLPTLANMKLFLHCVSLVICPPDTLAQLSVVSRKRGRVADVAVITRARALSGASDQARLPPVFYFPLVTRSRWHRNKSMCVGTRKILFDQFSLQYFLKISIKIDHQYLDMIKPSGYILVWRLG